MGAWVRAQIRCRYGIDSYSASPRRNHTQGPHGGWLEAFKEVLWTPKMRPSTTTSAGKVARWIGKRGVLEAAAESTARQILLPGETYVIDEYGEACITCAAIRGAHAGK